MNYFKLSKLLSLAIVFAAIIKVLAPAFAYATCGLSWFDIPHSPFVDERYLDYRFQHVEILDGAETTNPVKPSTNIIPISILFSPAHSIYPGGTLLGEGWWFPLFESVCFQTNKNFYKLYLPNGKIVDIENRANNTLVGDVWIGKKHLNDITFDSACGWKLKFSVGRLVEMRSPKNERYTFSISNTGARTISFNDRPIITLTRPFNEKTLVYDYHLTYFNGGKKQTTLLGMGERNVFIPAAKNTPKKSAEFTEQIKNRRSLRYIKKPNSTEKRFDFTTASLAIAGVRHVWDNATKNLLQKDDEHYSFVKVRGVQCFKTTFPDGTSTLQGSHNGWSISQSRGNEIRAWESIRISGKKPGTFKRVTRQEIQIDKQGNETLLSRKWYDENGELIKRWIKNGDGGLHIAQKGDTETITNAKTQALVRETKRNKDGQLVSFRTPAAHYTFSYLGDTVKVSRIVEGVEQTKEIPRLLFDSMTWAQ